MDITAILAMVIVLLLAYIAGMITVIVLTRPRYPSG